MSSAFKLVAQSAVNVLQQWYPGVVGLYAWDPGNDYTVTNEANIPNPNDWVAPVIKAAGLWNNLCDTLRWWNSANAITALVDYMLITNDRDPAYISAVTNTFANAPKAWRFKQGLSAGDIASGVTGNIESIIVHNTDFLDDFYDDDGWWALAWIKAYDLTDDLKYITQAETIFREMTNGWDGICKGGIYWQRNHRDSGGRQPYKNAIANELFLAVSAALYVRLSDPSYLDWAAKEWLWFQQRGLINSNNLINDSLNTSCINDGNSDVWTYNQGVILGGFVIFLPPQMITKSSIRQRRSRTPLSLNPWCTGRTGRYREQTQMAY
jgi:hypothetical protein